MFSLPEHVYSYPSCYFWKHLHSQCTRWPAGAKITSASQVLYSFNGYWFSQNIFFLKKNVTLIPFQLLKSCTKVLLWSVQNSHTNHIIQYIMALPCVLMLIIGYVLTPPTPSFLHIQAESLPISVTLYIFAYGIGHVLMVADAVIWFPSITHRSAWTGGTCWMGPFLSV